MLGASAIIFVSGRLSSASSSSSKLLLDAAMPATRISEKPESVLLAIGRRTARRQGPRWHAAFCCICNVKYFRVIPYWTATSGRSHITSEGAGATQMQILHLVGAA